MANVLYMAAGVRKENALIGHPFPNQLGIFSYTVRELGNGLYDFWRVW